MSYELKGPKKRNIDSPIRVSQGSYRLTMYPEGGELLEEYFAGEWIISNEEIPKNLQKVLDTFPLDKRK